MSRRVLLVITGEPVPSAARRRGDFAQMLREVAGPEARDTDWTVSDARESERLPDATEFDAIIISGSPALLGDGEPWMHRTMAYLERAREQTAILGVCFGHQLLGQALGGRVERNPRGREIGTVPLVAEAPCPLLDGTPPFWVNATHLDSITELPPGARVYGSTEQEAHAIVHFGARVWGVQFHPEMDREIISCYLQERRDALEEEGLDVEGLLSRATDAPEGSRVIANFFSRVVDGEAGVR